MCKTIFVITLGHTGSSEFAVLINQLGVPIHNKIVGHKDFYENRQLVNENKRIIPDDKELVDRKDITLEPRKDLDGLLKDPRTVMAFPSWYRAYPQAKWIFLMRNHDDIALDPALYLKRPDILKQRMQYFYEALEQCKDPLYVHYDMLTYDFERTMRRVAEFCQVPYKPLGGWKPKYYGRYIHDSDSAS